jgi:hypothetical protein
LKSSKPFEFGTFQQLFDKKEEEKTSHNEIKTKLLYCHGPVRIKNGLQRGVEDR